MRRSRTVSPAWFRAHILPLETWSSWDEAEADLLSDPDQQRRINELAADLTASGFEHPVTVGRDRWWHRRPRVRDGIQHHAGALAGFDERPSSILAASATSIPAIQCRAPRPNTS